MKDEEKLHFEEIRTRSLNHLRGLLPAIKALEEELGELKGEYKDYKGQYEEADYALAQIDGRLEKVNIGRHGKRPVQLSLDQIKNIAKKLGIKL
jgi:hypothetical protein